MNYLKSISAAIIIMLFISTISFAQMNEMMKKDSMKTKMMKEGMKSEMMHDKMMKKDSMKADMMKDKMMKHDMMDKDMHGKEMMMKIDKNMEGIAIKGYDPVGYFTDGKAEMGNSMHSYNWMGAEWHFMNEKHLNMFKENPEMYAPQFGGYCAYGVGTDHLASSDPAAWTIVDGKLYLNYSGDVKINFNKDVKGNIMKAEKHWPDLNKDEMK